VAAAKVTRLKLKEISKSAVHLLQKRAKGSETLLAIAVKNRSLRSPDW
jgi:hypothetical protein